MNPHAWLYVDGKGESGKVSNWSFEMGSPNGHVHRGWRKAELKKGDEATVEGYGAAAMSRTPAPLPCQTAGSYSGVSNPPPVPPSSSRASGVQ
jgi:hypothetical protein